MTANGPIDAAIELIRGLDGTMCKTDAEVAARLREQEHPEPVSPAALADLIDALGENRHEQPPTEDDQDVLARAVAARWGEHTVTAVRLALRSRLDLISRLIRDYEVPSESDLGQKLATECRRIGAADVDLLATTLARTRLAAERVGARVCLTCEQLIAPDLRSGLWRAARDVFTPGDSCASYHHRHTPEGTDG